MADSSFTTGSHGYLLHREARERVPGPPRVTAISESRDPAATDTFRNVRLCMKIGDRLNRWDVWRRNAGAACALAALLGASVRADTKPASVMDRMNLAAQLVQKGRVSEALEQQINPAIAEFEKEYGGSKRRVNSASGPVETLMYLTKAAEENQDAIAVDGGYAYAYFLKGYILVEQDDAPHAIENLAKALELSPNNPRFLCELGNIYQNRRDWAKAMELYERAADHAAVFDQKGDTFLQRRALRGEGFVLVELGRLDEAEKRYRRCLELDPNDRTAAGELRYITDLRGKAPK